jgi:hypothetical protein
VTDDTVLPTMQVRHGLGRFHVHRRSEGAASRRRRKGRLRHSSPSTQPSTDTRSIRCVYMRHTRRSARRRQGKPHVCRSIDAGLCDRTRRRRPLGATAGKESLSGDGWQGDEARRGRSHLAPRPAHFSVGQCTARWDARRRRPDTACGQGPACAAPGRRGFYRARRIRSRPLLMCVLIAASAASGSRRRNASRICP